MVNRPKQIGTAGETGIVRAAHRHGFPGAERRALHGNTDLGDILLCPGIILEAKTGQHAKTASAQQLHQWMVETELERVNAHAALAFLITHRTGYSPARADHWWAHTTTGTLHALTCQDITIRQLIDYPAPLLAGPPVHLELAHLLHVLVDAEWGAPMVPVLEEAS